MAEGGSSEEAQQPGVTVADTPVAHPTDGWVLTLDLADPSRLLAVLSDGRWGCAVAEAAWPPAGPRALPDILSSALSRLGAAALRLQLRGVLDAWPWEHELETAAGPRPTARYLTDLPPAAVASPPTPLVAVAGTADAHVALVQAARAQQRPLVMADPGLPATQRVALERSLRRHWRDPLLLSQALARALLQLGLPAGCCRLYGDGRAQLADTEQGWRPVTALSIDLVGSTQLLRTLGAEAYAYRLQAYHERCREVILRLHGSLDTPQGDDGLMGYFGFPLAVEDAATRALGAAWQLSAGMADLGLQVRIGVASGQVAVSAQQAFGPEVHLAARLCAAARPGQVLVAPSTRDRIGPGVLLEACGEDLQLKDFGGLKSIYCLVGLDADAAGRPVRAGTAARFVGRDHELTQLRGAWAAACEGQLQWCVVQGEAGIGKSRLLHEFSRELRAQGQRCLALAGQAQAGSSPYAAVVDALRQHWAIDAGTDPARLRRQLVGQLPGHDGPGLGSGLGSGHSEDLEALARLLTVSGGPEAAAPGGEARPVGDLLLDVLLAQVEPGPLCLLVDDAHWLDPSSIEVLRRLRQACAGRPLMVLLGERSGAGRALTLISDAALELQGLDEADAGALAAELGAALPEAVRRHIVERAEGFPLYLEESLRMISRREDGRRHDGAADGNVDSLPPGIGTPQQIDALPATLHDLLMVRLDELGPDRALAQMASVLGREFSAEHLEALLEQDDAFVVRARRQGSLGSLLESGLLQALDGALPGYRFKHALIRDAAYGSLWTHDRGRLHGLCAELIERCTPGLARQRPEHVAHHLEAAGRSDAARRAWAAAAKLSAARQAHPETLALAQRALALHAQLPEDASRARDAMQLHLLVASAQIALQGYGSAEVEAAYQAAERAGSALAGAAHTLRIRLGLEACYVMRGDLKRAAELAAQAVATTDWAQDERLALQARWAQANVHFHQGETAAALAGFDDCLAHYRPELHRRSSVQDTAVMCLGYSSWIHFELGQADEALRRIDRMLALADTLQHPFSTGVALGFAASVKRLCGDSEAAWPHAQEAVRICERGGFQVWLAHAWMARGQLRADRGDTHGGDDDMQRGYALWHGGGARISCATYLVTRAELLLRQGRTDSAESTLAEAWRISEQIGEHHYQAELLRLQGLAAWQSAQAGQQARAAHTLGLALELATRQRKPGLALRCALSLGALQAAQGEFKAPVQRLQGLLPALAQHGQSRDQRWAQQALAAWQAGVAFDSAEHSPWEPR